MAAASQISNEVWSGLGVVGSVHPTHAFLWNVLLGRVECPTDVPPGVFEAELRQGDEVFIEAKKRNGVWVATFCRPELQNKLSFANMIKRDHVVRVAEFYSQHIVFTCHYGRCYCSKLDIPKHWDNLKLGQDLKAILVPNETSLVFPFRIFCLEHPNFPMPPRESKQHRGSTTTFTVWECAEMRKALPTVSSIRNQSSSNHSISSSETKSANIEFPAEIDGYGLLGAVHGGYGYAWSPQVPRDMVFFPFAVWKTQRETISVRKELFKSPLLQPVHFVAEFEGEPAPNKSACYRAKVIALAPISQQIPHRERLKLAHDAKVIEIRANFGVLEHFEFQTIFFGRSDFPGDVADLRKEVSTGDTFDVFIRENAPEFAARNPYAVVVFADLQERYCKMQL